MKGKRAFKEDPPVLVLEHSFSIRSGRGRWVGVTATPHRDREIAFLSSFVFCFSSLVLSLSLLLTRLSLYCVLSSFNPSLPISALRNLLCVSHLSSMSEKWHCHCAVVYSGTLLTGMRRGRLHLLRSIKEYQCCRVRHCSDSCTRRTHARTKALSCSLISSLSPSLPPLHPQIGRAHV